MVVTGLDVNGALRQNSPLEAQLQATLNIVPAYAWYALPSGALTFVNERTADYLDLPKDHPNFTKAIHSAVQGNHRFSHADTHPMVSPG